MELCITPQKSTAYNFPLKYDSKLYRQNTDYVKMVLERKIQMQPSVMTDVHDYDSLHISATGKMFLQRQYTMRNQEVNKAAFDFGL